jgi:mono/diheme cytochrome c family protein
MRRATKRSAASVKSRPRTNPVLNRLLALSVVGAALLVAGCGGGESVTGQARADVGNGKNLFVGEGQCGRCHTLADAATVAQIGPNLDQAFGYACRQGFDTSTFFDIVKGQIDIPAQGGEMPADLVTGQDAVDVAAYVAGVAGSTVEGCGETETGQTGTTGGGQTGTGQTTTGATTAGGTTTGQS